MMMTIDVQVLSWVNDNGNDDDSLYDTIILPNLVFWYMWYRLPQRLNNYPQGCQGG